MMSAAVVEYARRKPARERLIMALFGSQRRLANALRSKVRLIVPAEPGPEQLLAAVQLYHPRARGDGGKISIESGSVLLTAATEIDVETARRAGLPPGMSAVYFVDVPEWRGSPSQVSMAREAKRHAMDSALRLIGGPAGRHRRARQRGDRQAAARRCVHHPARRPGRPGRPALRAGTGARRGASVTRRRRHAARRRRPVRG
jgi:hypothetical protein